MDKVINLRKKEVPEPEKKKIEQIQPQTIEPEYMPEEEYFDSPETLAWQIKNDIKKQPSWLLAGSLFGGALLVFLFASNPLFALLLAFFGVLVIIESKKEKAPTSVVALSETGVHLDDDHHAYHTLHSFWIDYEPGGKKELTVRTRKLLTPVISIPLEETDPLEVRAYMVSYLPEKEHEASLIEAVLRRFGL